MVIEEAINELNFLKRVMLRKEEIEALDMAASILGAYRQIIWERDIAIQQLKDLGYKLGEKPKENKDDLISRQSLIEEFADMRDGYPIITNDQLTVKDVIEIILSMPSVPKKETNTEYIKRTLSELAQYNADMLKAFNAGKELAEKEKGEWIPVSERLPEKDVAVLIWCPERKNIYCAYLEQNQWWIFGAYFQKVPLEVVEWRPLPEHYKAER